MPGYDIKSSQNASINTAENFDFSSAASNDSGSLTKDFRNRKDAAAREIAYKLFMRTHPIEDFGRELQQICKEAGLEAEIDYIVQKVDGISKLSAITHLSERQKETAADVVEMIKARAQKTQITNQTELSRQDAFVNYIVASAINKVVFCNEMCEKGLTQFILEERNRRFRDSVKKSKLESGSFHQEFPEGAQGSFDFLFLIAMYRTWKEFAKSPYKTAPNVESQGYKDSFLPMFGGEGCRVAYAKSFQQQTGNDIFSMIRAGFLEMLSNEGRMKDYAEFFHQKLCRYIFWEIDEAVKIALISIAESIKVNNANKTSFATEAINKVCEFSKARMSRKDALLKNLRDELLVAAGIADSTVDVEKHVSFKLRHSASDYAAKIMSYVPSSLGGAEESTSKITYKDLLDKVASALDKLKKKKARIELDEKFSELVGKVLDALNQGITSLNCVGAGKKWYENFGYVDLDQAGREVIFFEDNYNKIIKLCEDFLSYLHKSPEEQITIKNSGFSSREANYFSNAGAAFSSGAETQKRKLISALKKANISELKHFMSKMFSILDDLAVLPENMKDEKLMKDLGCVNADKKGYINHGYADSDTEGCKTSFAMKESACVAIIKACKDCLSILYGNPEEQSTIKNSDLLSAQASYCSSEKTLLLSSVDETTSLFQRPTQFCLSAQDPHTLLNAVAVEIADILKNSSAQQREAQSAGLNSH